MPWKRWSENAGPKILAFLAALALWFAVTNEIEFEKTLAFPIEYVETPDGLTPVTELPTQVRVNLRARGKFLGYRLRGGVLRVDLSPCTVGPNNVVIDGQSLVLPADVAVAHREVVSPRQVNVELDETVTRDVAINVDVAGQPDPKHVRVGKVFLSPAVARVSGPRKLVDDIGLLSTEPVDIGGHRNTLRKRVRLLEAGPPTVLVRPMTVEVGITIEPRVELELAALALDVDGPLPEGHHPDFRPTAIQVRISGAKSVLDVAGQDVTRVSLKAARWPAGTTSLQFKEVRGDEIVFVRRGQAAGKPPTGTNGDPPADLTEVIARMTLPEGVDIVGVRPEQLSVSIARAPAGPR